MILSKLDDFLSSVPSSQITVNVFYNLGCLYEIRDQTRAKQYLERALDLAKHLNIDSKQNNLVFSIQ